MTNSDPAIDAYIGYPWSSGGAGKGFLDYDLAHLGGEEGAGVTLPWAKARKVFLRERVGPPNFISYYTVDTPYEDMAKELADSLDRLNMPHEFEGLASRGSWVANTCLKSECVSRFWNAAEGPICWLDADSTVAREPWFLCDNPFDFAIVRRHGWRFMSGMIFLNKTAGAQALLTEWTALCKRYPYVWDQALLSFAWYTVARRGGIRTLWLPVDIFDIPAQGNAISLKNRLKAFRNKWLYRPHRRMLPKFFLQKQASRTQKKSANTDARQFEIGSDMISRDFREALSKGDLRRDFTIRDVFPMIDDYEG